MKYAFVAAQGKTYSLVLMCRILGVSRSGYYAWSNRPESRRAREDRRLVEEIKTIHKKSRKTYGSPRVHRELVKIGERCGIRRVERLMAENGIRAKQKKKFVATTDSKHDLPVAENLLNREFAINEIDKVWVSDITYVPTEEGWLYLAGVLDLCSRAAVGWSMSDSLDRKIVVDALEMAYSRRRPAGGVIHHSDRGSQYASQDYRDLLDSYDMLASMSRKGDCWDNAPMESFFGTLKRELVHHRKYRTREEARREIFEYIEVFYNRERLHSSLGYVSPAEFEAVLAMEQAA